MMALGIDVGLVNTGLAAVREGRLVWKGTIRVHGDAQDTGPRYAVLQKALARVFGRIEGKPDVVAVEQPELGVRPGRDVGDILKLYGAFAVTFAEAQRSWPRARVMGVEARSWKGSLGKSVSARVFALRYGVRAEDFENDHESDALGIADYGLDYARILARARAGRNGLTASPEK